MKKPLNQWRHGRPLLKFDLKMKLTTLLLIMTLFGLHANDSYAQKAKVTLDVENNSVSQIIDNIESVTEFRFIYKTKHVDLQRKLSLKVTNELIDTVLENMFKNTRTEYKVRGTQIILRESRKTLKEVIIQSNNLQPEDQLQVTGQVKDANGVSLGGANIIEKGTTNGTQADFDGNFSISVSDNAVLVVSFIGFATKEIVVDGQTRLEITLDESASGLDEVVVVGYGTQRKSDLTGAVSSISKDAIETRPISNIEDVFQGNAAGVSVNSAGGAPGSGVQIRIRGIGSINSNIDPLFVVDGLPYDGNLNSINPYDIESIEILKDASATAIFGSRGANGVVLITTKRGSNSGVQVEYNGTYGVQQVIKKIGLLNGTEYMQYVNEANVNAGQTAPFTAEDIASVHNNGEGTDWQDEFFTPAPIQTHQISARGGTEDVKFYLSANYLGQDGIINKSDFERFSVRANLDVKLGENFTIGNTLAISRQSSSGVATGTTTRSNTGNSNVIYSALIAPPSVPVFDENGDLTSEVTIGPDPGPFQNPLLLLDNINETKINQTVGNVYLQYDINDWLSAKTTFGFNLRDIITGTYINSAIVGSNGGRAARSTTQSTNWVSTNQLDFNKTFGDHQLNGTVVAEMQQFDSENFNASSQTFVLDNLTFNALETGSNPQIPASGISQWSLASYLARVNYSYKDKYLLTMTGRYDGASRLAAGNQWNFFPSAGVSWKISNESFMESVEAIDELKLRLSYGEAGSQSVGVYSTLSQLQGDQAIIGVNEDINTGFAPANFPNPDLTWEISKQLNAGFDVSLFQRGLSVSAEYFERETEGLFFDRALPSVVGTNSLTTTTNIGSVQNTGVEVVVDANIVRTDDFNWNVAANFTYTKNEVLRLAEQDTIVTGFNGEFGQGQGSQILYAGGSLGTFRGWVRDGLYDNDVSLTLDGSTRSPGDLKYVDLDGDGDITINDRRELGSAIPDKFWGLTNTFTYKGVSLSIFLQGSHGNKISNFMRTTYLENLTGGGNVSDVALNRWTPQNTNTNIPLASLNAQPFRFSDEWLEDGGYVRFKTITLGYDFPNDILEKMGGLSSFRIYATGTNLITFSNYSGFDPDVSRSDTVTQQGYDQGVYPSSKSIVIGLNIGL